MMKLSVIVTSYNNAHNVARCIGGILDQRHPPLLEALEIIVVDSGSTDDSAAELRKYGGSVRVLHSPGTPSRPLSAAAARNLGAQYAQGEILAFIDSDCSVGANWIQTIVQHFSDSEVDAVIGSREPDCGPGLGTFVRRYEYILYSNKFTSTGAFQVSMESVEDVGRFMLLASNNFMMKRSLWMRIGGMKDIFPGEDIVLELDILRQGSCVLFDPQLVVSHNHPLSFSQLICRSWKNGIATHVVSRYSNGLVNSRHFHARGRNLNMSAFMKTLSCIAALSAICLVEHLKVLLIGALLILGLVSYGYQVAVIKKRLISILGSRGAKHLDEYRLDSVQVGVFLAAHFIIKLVASIGIMWAPLGATRRPHSGNETTVH